VKARAGERKRWLIGNALALHDFLSPFFTSIADRSIPGLRLRFLHLS
jgi:hypothetical protein